MSPEVFQAEVTWIDAARTDGSLSGREDIGIVRETTGWVLRSDATGVIVALSRDTINGAIEYERGFMIPRLYVKKVRRLK